MIELHDRILLNDGTSIVSEEFAIDYILEHGDLPDYLKVFESKDAKNYNLKYGVDIIADESPEDPVYCQQYMTNDDFNELLSYIVDKRDDTPDDKHWARLEEEIEWVIEDDSRKCMIYMLINLINRFRSDNIVWGVGRGSSCASYLLYLIGVHDVNPVKYDISFKEFSK